MTLLEELAYGLGNEYMGILIGSVIMGWALMAQMSKISQWVLQAVGVVLFMGALIVIGAPAGN